MAYYNYYQNSQPAWGTQQDQFVAPPMPRYQPQPSWHGGDYYRAHSDSLDHTLFDYVWSKAKNMLTGTSVGRKEASHWWKRVYGGIVDPSKILPREIGAAAGYEAIRLWEHHKTIYVQPLSDDRGREREALIGLAVGEATKLWEYTQRPRDKYGRMEASEVAAATASRIFNHSPDYDSPYEAYESYSRPRTRRRSTSGTRRATPSGSFYDDTNAVFDTRTDYLEAYPHRGRSHSRTRHSHGRSSSRYHSPSPVSFSRRGRSHSRTRHSHGRSSSRYHSPSSLSPVVYGVSSTVGYQPGYDTVPGSGYYPEASPYHGSSSTVYPYQEASPVAGYAVAGGSPYSYAGASVGLPPPPTGDYLATPETYRHHRSRSTGGYGATRPNFGY